MKIRGKNPTREERKILVREKLDTYTWLIQSHTPTELKVIHRETGEVKTLDVD